MRRKFGKDSKIEIVQKAISDRRGKSKMRISTKFTPLSSASASLSNEFIETLLKTYSNESWASKKLWDSTIDHINDKRILFEVDDNKSFLAAHGIRQPGVTAVLSDWTVKTEPGTKEFEK